MLTGERAYPSSRLSETVRMKLRGEWQNALLTGLESYNTRLKSRSELHK